MAGHGSGGGGMIAVLRISGFVCLVVALGFGAAVAGAQTSGNDPSMTDKAVQALEGKSVDLVAPFTVPNPLVCTWAQDHQRARCGARVTEGNLPDAEDYLQIYVATDSNEFDRNKTAIDTTAAKAGYRYRTEDPITLTLQNSGKTTLQTYCEQGLNQTDAFAFCAVAIGQHVVVESQVSPPTSTVAGRGSADVDRARDLVAPGVLYAIRMLVTTLAPGTTP
jgi:hypothetical protein